MNKAPVLSDEQIDKWCEERRKETDGECVTSPYSCYLCVCEAQRDADHKYCLDKIEQTIKDDATRCAKYMKNQAREIFEEIESYWEIYREEGQFAKFRYDYNKYQSLKSKFLSMSPKE